MSNYARKEEIRRDAALVKEIWEKHQELPMHLQRFKTYEAAVKWFAQKYKDDWRKHTQEKQRQ